MQFVAADITQPMPAWEGKFDIGICCLSLINSNLDGYIKSATKTLRSPKFFLAYLTRQQDNESGNAVEELLTSLGFDISKESNKHWVRYKAKSK
jgi:hypothetical protein